MRGLCIHRNNDFSYFSIIFDQSKLCSKVYAHCEFAYAASITLIVVIAMLALMIVGTAIVAHKFTQTESFSMSLQ